jgi:hypothetical protein
MQNRPRLIRSLLPCLFLRGLSRQLALPWQLLRIDLHQPLYGLSERQGDCELWKVLLGRFRGHWTSLTEDGTLNCKSFLGGYTMKPDAKDRAKRILLELVRQAGGVFYNKTNLFKVFWKAHLEYSAVNPGYLSGWPIVKMPGGPGIDKADKLIGEMMEDGWLTLSEQPSGPYMSMVFALGDHAPPCALDRDAVEAIRQGVAAVDGKSARKVSDDSHKQSRAWNEAEMGRELDVYSDLLTDGELNSIDDSLESLAAASGVQLSNRRKMSVNPIG